MFLKFDLIMCLNVKAHFPASTASFFPRIQMTATLPNLEELTFCSWFRPYSLDDLNTLLSYATSATDNQFIIGLKTSSNKTNIAFYNGASPVEVSCSHVMFQVGEWYHICINVFSPTGSVAFFVNGIYCKDFKNHASFIKKHVPSGGVLIIGQEQDGLNSKFDANQAWFGDIADLQIWSESLTQEQILEAGKCKGKRKQGDVFAWMKTKISVFDNVIFSETQLCNP